MLVACVPNYPEVTEKERYERLQQLDKVGLDPLYLPISQITYILSSDSSSLQSSNKARVGGSIISPKKEAIVSKTHHILPKNRGFRETFRVVVVIEKVNNMTKPKNF